MHDARRTQSSLKPSTHARQGIRRGMTEALSAHPRRDGVGVRQGGEEHLYADEEVLDARSDVLLVVGGPAVAADDTLMYSCTGGCTLWMGGAGRGQSCRVGGALRAA